MVALIRATVDCSSGEGTPLFGVKVLSKFLTVPARIHYRKKKFTGEGCTLPHLFVIETTVSTKRRLGTKEHTRLVARAKISSISSIHSFRLASCPAIHAVVSISRPPRNSFIDTTTATTAVLLRTNVDTNQFHDNIVTAILFVDLFCHSTISS